MNKWRPKRWKNPHPIEPMTKPEFRPRDAFEAGADAMLEALKARGFLDMGKADKLSISGIYERPIKFEADCDGKLVLIPND